MEFFPILPMPEPDMLDFPILHSVNSTNVFLCHDKATAVHRMENGQNRLNTIVLGNISEFTETDQSVGPYQTLT